MTSYKSEPISHRDPRSFQFLYSEIKPYLVRKAVLILQNNFEAEDIVTDVFLSYLRKPLTFLTLSEAKNYFHRCVKNASLNRVRQNRRARLFKENFRLFIDDERENYFLPQYVRKELHTELNAAVETISARPKIVCKLLFYEGLSLNEAAFLMKLSKNTVKNHRTAVVNLLREKVNVDLR